MRMCFFVCGVKIGKLAPISIQTMTWYPDRTFLSLRAPKSGDRRALLTSETP